MKLPYKLGILIIATCTLFSCNDEDLNFDNKLQPASDSIYVNADTFHISTSTAFLDSVPMLKNTSTFLLGTYSDSIFGEKKADILAQLACPNITNFPSIDSSSMYIEVSVSNILTKGDPNYSISAYRMDRGTIENCSSNAKVSDYCSKSVLLGTVDYKITTAGSILINVDSKFKDELLDSLKNKSAIFNSNESFIKYFNGIYLTFNDASSKKQMMLSINALAIKLSYTYKNEQKQEITNTLYFPANKEVRQINVVNKSINPNLGDSLFCVSSPAGAYGKLKIPIAEIKRKFGVYNDNGVLRVSNGKRLNVNSAFINIQVSGVTDTSKTTDIDYPDNLILIKKSEFSTFFSKTLPSNLSTEMIASYQSSTNSYRFDIMKYLYNELKNSSADNDELILIPATVGTVTSSSGTTSVTSVTHDYSFSAVKLKSGSNSTPLKMDVVITGF